MNHRAARAKLCTVTLLVASPLTAAQWTRVAGPEGGEVTRVLPVPGEPGVVLAAQERGIYRSEDSGSTWSGPAPGSELVEVADLAHHPTQPIALAATEDGILRSTDGGATWEHVQISGHSSERAFAVRFDPLQPFRALAIYESGIEAYPRPYSSEDFGATWTPAGPPISPQKGLEVSPITGDLLVFGNDGVWRAVSRGGPFEIVVADAVQDMATSFASPSTVWALAEYALWLSQDGGLSWQVHSPLPERVVRGSLAVDRRDPRRLLLASDTGGLWISENGGLRWIRVASLSGGVALIDLASADWDEGLWFGASGNGLGVWRSTDRGIGWEHASRGVEAQVSRLFVAPQPASTMLALGKRCGLFTSRDGGASWSPILIPGVDGVRWREAAYSPVDANMLLLRGNVPHSGNALFMTFDGGRQWRRLPSPVTSLHSGLAIGPSGTLYVNADDYLARSTDLGETWTIEWDILPVSIVPDPVHASIVYVTDLRDRLAKSMDGGNTWMLDERVPVGRLALQSRNPRRLFATCPYCDSPPMHTSFDGGRHWRSMGSDLPADRLVLDIEVDPSRPTRLVVSIEGPEVWHSEDAGRSFHPLSRSFPFSWVRDLAVRSTERSELWVVAENLWKLDL